MKKFEHARALGFVVKNIRLKPEEIQGQLLLANSLIGVVPVGPAKTKQLLDLIDFFRMDTRMNKRIFFTRQIFNASHAYIAGA